MLRIAPETRSKFRRNAKDVAYSLQRHGNSRAEAGDARARQLVRILTPLAKFRACRDNIPVATGAMEVRGGNGYIEDFVNARLIRDATVGDSACLPAQRSRSARCETAGGSWQPLPSPGARWSVA